MPATAADAVGAADTAACLAVMRQGSRTFFLAARLLPRARLAEFAAIYAFCREADDAIDLSTAPQTALAALHARLQAVGQAAQQSDQAAESLPSGTDRALARTLRARKLALLPLHALLDGFAWDAHERRYETLQDTLAYAARAAGSVGVLLTQLLGVNDAQALARAADMGVAMQLTNICRDVGEDARRGRVYLPERWLQAAGTSRAALCKAPAPHPALAHVVARLLRVADGLYARARTGLPALPLGARLAVAAAARLYADIGRSVARAHYDSVNRRAQVGSGRKGWLVLRALVDVARASLPGPQRRRGPLASCAFLLPDKLQ